MRFLNPAVEAELRAGRRLMLNLGAGLRRLPGYFNVDLVELPGVDILADLEEPLDLLPDDSVERIYTRHTLEHVQRLLPLLAEMHRVTHRDGLIEVIVPHFSNPYGYSDPTHQRFFGLYSFHYFARDEDQARRRVPNFYIPQRFRVESVRINLLKEGLLDRVIRAALHPILNRGVAWLDWYERRLCRLIPADDLHWRLRVVKDAPVPLANP